MKYIATGTALVLLCTAGYAATTCLHSYTAVAVVRKNVNPIASSYNSAERTFTLTMDYDIIPGNENSRTLYGEATCNEITTDTSGATIAVGDVGAANTHLRATTGDVGTRCWCALTRPVSSWWTYYKTFDSDDACANGCASACAAAIKDNTSNFRSNGVFMAIW